MQVQAAHSTCSSRFVGSASSLRSLPFTNARIARRGLQVHAAITKEKKEKIISSLKEKLDSSSVVFSVRFKDVDVATQQRIRKGLPEGTSTMVCKNTLMRVAANDLGLTEITEKGCKGENMWIFVPEDEIRAAVKFWFQIEDDLFKAAKAAAAKGEEPAKPTEVRSAFLDRGYITVEELKKCEDMPTKMELFARIAGAIKAVPTKLGRSINAIPTKLVRGINAVSELDEDKSLTTIAAVKPKTEEA